MVEWLLGDEINQTYRAEQITATASGNFFKLFVFSFIETREKSFDFSGRPCYYGETPIAFACCTNQWGIAEILLKHGASMDVVRMNRSKEFYLDLFHGISRSIPMVIISYIYL